jgi:hypothetical protein
MRRGKGVPPNRQSERDEARGGGAVRRVRTDDDDNISFLLAVGFLCCRAVNLGLGVMRVPQQEAATMHMSRSVGSAQRVHALREGLEPSDGPARVEGVADSEATSERA